MANIKSAKKRIKTTKTKTERNQASKSKIKMYNKKLESLAKSGNKDEAKSVLKEATMTIDKAARKGVFHKNTGSRKISRLQKLVNKIS